MTSSIKGTQKRVSIVDASTTMKGTAPTEWSGTTMKVKILDNGKPLECTVQFKWTTFKGKAKPTRLTLEVPQGSEISSDLIHALPLKDLKKIDTDQTLKIMRSTSENAATFEKLMGYPLFSNNGNPSKTVSRKLKANKHVRRKRITDDEYRSIGAIWEELTARGVPNISKQMSEDLYLADSTIRKRIQECRARGYIPESERQKPVPKKRKRSRHTPKATSRRKRPK